MGGAQVNAISFSEHHVPAPEQAAQRSESAPHAEPSSSDPEPYENGDSSPPGTQASSGDPAQASDNPSGHPSGGWPMGRRLHRHAVLEADVTNRTDLALQVMPHCLACEISSCHGCGMESTICETRWHTFEPIWED